MSNIAKMYKMAGQNSKSFTTVEVAKLLSNQDFAAVDHNDIKRFTRFLPVLIASLYAILAISLLMAA